MNWRSSTPHEVVEDVDSLTQDSVEAAAEFLSAHDSFTPFMLTIALSGDRQLRNLGTQPPTPDESMIVRALTLSDDVNSLRARACVMGVVAREPFAGDAIKLKIEHRSGFCSDLLIPYLLTDDALDIDMNSANAAPASPLLWARAGIADAAEPGPNE